MLVLEIVVYRKFATELRPLIDARIWFLLHILRMNGQNSTKFCIHIIFDKIYVGRQIVGIPMGTNCAPLVADLFLFCYERDLMKDLSSDNQADVIKGHL